MQPRRSVVTRRASSLHSLRYVTSVQAPIHAGWNQSEPELTATPGGTKNTRASTEPAQGQIGRKMITQKRYNRRSE